MTEFLFFWFGHIYTKDTPERALNCNMGLKLGVFRFFLQILCKITVVRPVCMSPASIAVCAWRRTRQCMKIMEVLVFRLLLRVRQKPEYPRNWALWPMIPLHRAVYAVFPLVHVVCQRSLKPGEHTCTGSLFDDWHEGDDSSHTQSHMESWCPWYN